MPKLDNLSLFPMPKIIPVQLWWKRLKLAKQNIGNNYKDVPRQYKLSWLFFEAFIFNH